MFRLSMYPNQLGMCVPRPVRVNVVGNLQQSYYVHDINSI